MQYVSLSVGVGVDGLTSSLVNVGQPVISAASNGVTFLQAGIMPSLAGGILPPVPGDFDGNRRVDLNDYSGFEDCLAGPDSGVGEQCDIGDFDGDGDLDLEDVDAFMRRFTGPGS
jgi:hypothetical protein